MKFFNLHTHQNSNQSEVVELINQYPQEFNEKLKTYSIGIHPLYIDENRLEQDFDILNEKIQLDDCLAVGECGLDNRSETPLELQLKIFERQLILAENYQKPVVIHCVGAFHELIVIKKRLKISVPLIVHGFSKNAILAKQLIDNGFYLSFGKNLLRNPELESVFIAIPNNRFFLETDMVEEGIQVVYALAAKYKKIEIDQIQQMVSDNFTCVFNKKMS